MICDKCQKENREGSKFCRFCGNELSDVNNITTDNKMALNFDIPGNIVKLKHFIIGLNRKILVIALLVILVSGGAVYAAPKMGDYIKVNQLIKQATMLGNQGNYRDALAALNLAEGKWTLGSKKSEVNDLKARQERYAKDQENFSEALEKENAGDFFGAKDLLQKIDTDFPNYSLVKDKLIEAQNKIESDLKSKVDVAVKAKAEAKRQADAAAAAAARAEADKQAAQSQAEAAERAKAQADAQATAQAQAAQEAQARADALRSAQTNAYWDKWKRAQTYITSGHSNISSALSYLGASSFTSALSYLTYALSDYGSAKNILGGDYIAENRSAHLYLQLALDNYIEEEKTLFNAVYYLDSSYISRATYYADEGNRYVQLSNDSLGKY